MINKDSRIKIGKSSYDISKFMARFKITTEDEALEIMQEMVDQGVAIIKTNETKEQELLEKVQKTKEKNDKVIANEKEKQAYRDMLREKKNEDEEKLKISLAYPTENEALEMEKFINQELNVPDTSIVKKKGVISLVVEDISITEYNSICRRYKADKTIKKGLGVVNSASKTATDGTNYLLNKVVSPASKIATEAGMNIGKGLFHTAVKTGASLVTSSGKAIRETKDALQNDAELNKASAELRIAKKTIKNNIFKFLNKKSSGINILDD